MDELTLKEAFDELMGSQKFDSRMAKKAKLFQVQFVHDNHDHRAFFGGNLIGVHRIRFVYNDYTRYFNDVVDVDEDVVLNQVRRVTTINHDFKISGDPMNLTVMYQVHRFMTSPYLNEKARIDACRDVVLVFLYRSIAALLAHYFKYPIDTETAQAVYERLSGRYLIKKLGTWQAVFNYRADEFIGKESVHIQAVIKFNDDTAIVNAINDLQGRIKDMLKNIYAEFIHVHEHGGKIGSGSATMIDADGEEIVKDKVHGLESYQHYILSVVGDRNSFYKQELVDVVAKVIPTVHGKAFPLILDWMTSELNSDHREQISKFIEHVLSMAYNYLLENEYVLHRSRDILLLTSKLKGFILSSRSNSEELEIFRKEGDAIVKASSKQSNNQTVAALRNGLFLYISLRAFTKHAYGG